MSAIGTSLVGSGAPAATPAATGAPSSARVPVGRPSPVSGGATRLGSAPDATRLHLDVVLKPRDPGALAGLATAVSTPGNPLFRHFLPQGRLARAFGPTPATVATVRAALRDAGLSPGPLSADGLVIPVTTTVGRADAGLRTRIASYRLASGRTAVADTIAPSLPAPIASAVQTVIGLNTTIQAQPQVLSVPKPVTGRSPTIETEVADVSPGTGTEPCDDANVAATAYDSYTSEQLTFAYSFDDLYAADDEGTGATLALVELEPYKASDIATFQSCYATGVPVTTVPVDGGAGTGPGSGEAALDIENVIELAPGVGIDVYEAPNTATGILDDYSAIAAADSAQVVSTSWGLCEALAKGEVSAENTIFEEMTAQGQTVVADSGDSGSEDCMPSSGLYTLPHGRTPDAVAVDPATATVYVANRRSDDVTAESESQQARVLTIRAGADPDGITVDPATHNVYVADGTSPGSVSVIPGATCDADDHSDCASTTIEGLGDDPIGIAVDPNAGTVYVANEGSGTVSVISVATGAVVGTVALGTTTAPVGIAVDTASHDVYVTDSGSDTVSVIDGTSCDATTQTGCGATPATIVVGDGPQGVAVDPVTDTAYVADTLGDNVSVIRGSTATVSATVGVSDPVGVALSPSGGQVLVTGTSCSSSGGTEAGTERRPGKCGNPTVAVIAAASDTVTAYLPTDSDPVAVAVDPSTGYAYSADSTGSGGRHGDLGVLPLFLDVDDPADQPDVTGVGGTDLSQWVTGVESAWGDPANPTVGERIGAGGGGISSVFAMPSYQSTVVGAQSSATPCAAAAGDYCREVPDVSASASYAHGYVIYYNGTWTALGGTSGAAPLWADIAALAVTLNGPVQRLGNINPDLYRFAAKGLPDFNDITKGDDDFTTTNGGAYAAGPGYDMATGLGSPKASALATDLDLFVVTADPASQTVVAGQVVSFTVATAATSAPTVQWDVSTDGGATFTSIPEATSDTYSFVATAAQDGDEYEAVLTGASGSLTTTVATLDVFAITTLSLPEATRGIAYRVHLDAIGGLPPYTWACTGALPKGLALTADGLLSGRPKVKNTKPATYTVTVTATTSPSSGQPRLTATQTLTLTLL